MKPSDFNTANLKALIEFFCPLLTSPMGGRISPLPLGEGLGMGQIWSLKKVFDVIHFKIGLKQKIIFFNDHK
jgi:hypothetical protein